MKHLINHIVFVVDKSGSMNSLKNDVVKVFDGQIKHLAKSSQELKQETRVSVYLFDDKPECVVWDMDVLRLPSLAALYQIGGNTALIDAAMLAVTDLKKTPELYCDHAFLTYVLTDGQENRSRQTPGSLTALLNGLADNWTVATLVPDETGVRLAQQYGLPAGNIQIWSTDTAGLNKAGSIIQTATDNYMRARATGVRSTKNLFNLDVSALNKTLVKTALEPIKPSEYDLLIVRKDGEAIKPFVESWLKSYTVGSAYYQLNKPETIQPTKNILVQERATGKIFGGSNARKLMNLPDYEVKVKPTTNDKFVVFCQSTSVNRKLVSGTHVIVLK